MNFWQMLEFLPLFNLAEVNVMKKLLQRRKQRNFYGIHPKPRFPTLIYSSPFSQGMLPFLTHQGSSLKKNECFSETTPIPVLKYGFLECFCCCHFSSQDFFLAIHQNGKNTFTRRSRFSYCHARSKRNRNLSIV